MNKNEKSFLLLSGLICLLAFCGTVLFIDNRIDFMLNSDDSSELILAQLLASENQLLSQDWHYSTELRVVNTQIFYTFFFKIFQNWHDVRIASYICLYLVMLAAYYFICKELKIRKYFLITATLLMIPFSTPYFGYILKGAYYIPHIAIIFFTLGLCEAYVSEMSNRKQKIYLLIASLSSILAGLGGPRQIIVLYIPLVLTSLSIAISNLSVHSEKITCHLTKEDKKYLLFSIISSTGGLIGYLINAKVLSKIFSFRQWNDILFADFDIIRLAKIIDGFFISFGYTQGKIFSAALLHNFTGILWFIVTVITCIYILKHKDHVISSHYRISLFASASSITFILLYSFTNLYYSNAYNLPIVILSIPLMAILFQNTKFSDSIKFGSITTLILLIAFSGCYYYKGYFKTDSTIEFRNITAALQNEQYTKGYATFGMPTY